MRYPQSIVLCLAFGLFASGSAVADVSRELLPAERSIAEVVDHYVNERLRQVDVTAAPQADEATILRRTTLDTVGRIPTVGEVRGYLAADPAQRRMVMVDRLLASPGFARHQANELNTMLMSSGGGDLLTYLRKATTENRPWDQIFRELLAADPESGADRFLKSRVSELDRLANDTSVIFFGVNVSCAQCHDHPLVPEWTQTHFFGMKSFFSRTFENGGFLGERDYGLVKYQTTAGEEKVAPLMFLTGTLLEEPEAAEPTDEAKKAEKQQLEELKKNKQPPSPPTFSRREQLVRVALQEHVYFSRSIVNRLWARLFGRGLVAPVDQMHPENPASHPELLDWLARDLVEHQYDLRRLMRGLVLSEAYSRSSRWDDSTPPSADLFALAAVRPMTPTQYATSLRLASMSPDWFPADIASEEFSQRIEQVENSARGFAGLIDQLSEDFQVSVTEALLFNNSERVANEFLRDSGDSLVGRLKASEDSRELVETACWNVFTRPPDAEEIQLLQDYVTNVRTDRAAATQQLVWALLTTNELRFNY